MPDEEQRIRLGMSANTSSVRPDILRCLMSGQYGYVNLWALSSSSGSGQFLVLVLDYSVGEPPKITGHHQG